MVRTCSISVDADTSPASLASSGSRYSQGAVTRSPRRRDAAHDAAISAGCQLAGRTCLFAHHPVPECPPELPDGTADRKSTRLNSSHTVISYAVFCLKKKNLTQCFNFAYFTYQTCQTIC